MLMHCKRNHRHIMYMFRFNISNLYITLSRGMRSAVICSQGVMFVRILLACEVNMVGLLRASEVQALEIFSDAFVCLGHSSSDMYVQLAVPS